MNVVVRVDASIHIGSGHVMRCLVLAEALKDQGHSVSFVMRPQKSDMFDFVERRGFNSIALPAIVFPIEPKDSADYQAWLQVSETQDVEDFINLVDQVDLVVVDHYGLNAVWEQAIQSNYGCKMAVIDDLVRVHHANVIIDQTFGRDPEAYRDSQVEHVLSGVGYALVNKHFLTLHEMQKLDKQKVVEIHKVLVSMGGIDKPNATLKVLKALKGKVDPKIQFTVLLSPKAFNYPEVAQFCRLEKDWIKHFDFVDDMATMMQQHSLAIGAPGSTSWERACLGLPSIVIPLAENQQEIAQKLDQNMLAIKLEIENIETEIVEKFSQLMLHHELYRKNNLLLCDGKGANRVMQAINGLVQDASLPKIRLRKATLQDIESVYQWQCLPETRRYAHNPKAPSWEEHSEWMQKKLKEDDSYFYVIDSEADNRSVGVVRLDLEGDGFYLISIFIEPVCFGKGIAKQALGYIDQLHPSFTLRAVVLPENLASQRLFLKAHYQQVMENTFIRLPIS